MELMLNILEHIFSFIYLLKNYTLGQKGSVNCYRFYLGIVVNLFLFTFFLDYKQINHKNKDSVDIIYSEK